LTAAVENPLPNNVISHALWYAPTTSPAPVTPLETKQP